MLSVNRNPGPGELRRFGVAMLVGFGAFGLLAWFAPALRPEEAPQLERSLEGTRTAAVALWALGVVLLLSGFGPVRIARPIYVAWMSVAVALGMVVSTILLTVLFAILLPVFSLIVRRSNPLRRKPGSGTYWEPHPPFEPAIERMQRLF